MERIEVTARRIYRQMVNLGDALVDLAQFHDGDGWESDMAQVIEREVARVTEPLMSADEAARIVAEYGSKRGRPPMLVLQARAALKGEVYVDPRKGRALEHISADKTATDSRMACPVRPDELRELLTDCQREAHRLAVRESRIARAYRADDARARAVLVANGREARATWERARAIWPEGTAVWDTTGHLSGEQAAIRNNDGTHWTTSAKGHTTTIRYGDGEARSTNKRHTSSALHTIHELHEPSIADLAAIEAA